MNEELWVICLFKTQCERQRIRDDIGNTGFSYIG